MIYLLVITGGPSRLIVSYLYLTMPSVVVVGYCITVTQTAELLESLSLIPEKEEIDDFLAPCKENSNEDSEEEGCKCGDDFCVCDCSDDECPNPEFWDKMEDEHYSSAFYRALNKGLTFNGVHCDAVQYYYCDEHTYIGKVLYKSNQIATATIDPEQVAKAKEELTNLDPFFQGSPQLYIIMV